MWPLRTAAGRAGRLAVPRPRVRPDLPTQSVRRSASAAPAPDRSHRRGEDHDPPHEQPEHLRRGYGGALDHLGPQEEGPPGWVGEGWAELIARTYLRSRQLPADGQKLTQRRF